MVSRIANNPIEIPSGVEVTLEPGALSVKGKLGQLCESIHESVKVEKTDGVLKVVALDDSIEGNALAGTTRALLNNMVHGVSEGFQRKLVMVGVGYRAKAQGKSLDLSVGFSHPVKMAMPEGITVETPAATEIVIKGSNKQQVAQIAANIRAIRPPEPYKGKGIRYENEHVVRKETKKK